MGCARAVGMPIDEGTGRVGAGVGGRGGFCGGRFGGAGSGRGGRGGGGGAAAVAGRSWSAGPLVEDGVSDGDRTYALLNHLAGLSNVALGFIPFVSLIATLVMWQVGKKRSGFVADHGAEAVNFQLSLLLYYLLAIVGGVVLAIVTLGVGAVVFALAPVFGFLVLALNVVGCVMGMLAASRGRYFRYPMAVRFIAG